MEQEELQKLIQLRQYVIEEFKSLKGKGDALSTVKQDEIAYTFSSIVKSMDDLLS
tara:strand:- start:91 stop:255 length:165 start_codon:yes stop_codon:yes gene_type:complete